MTIARAAALVLALAACAWFGLGVVQARDIDRATTIIAGPVPLSPAEAAHAGSLVHTAATLDPDSDIQLLRAELAADQGHTASAIAQLRSVVASEPENLDAWVALAQLALHRDRALLTRAAIQVDHLDPRLK
jgi:predicted Zn-dependent protease